MPEAHEASSRERRRDRNLAAILDAARGLVIERGPEGLSLREVARRADYSAAALYRYFSSKDDLIAAVGMDSLRVLGSHVEAVPRTLAPAERLEALCEAYVGFAEHNPEQFALFSRLHLAPTDWQHYVTVAWPFTIIIEAVSEAMDAGAVTPGDPAVAALGLWSLAHGFASLRAGHLRDVKADHETMRRAAFRTHVQGLSKGPAR